MVGVFVFGLFEWVEVVIEEGVVFEGEEGGGVRELDVFVFVDFGGK